MAEMRRWMLSGRLMVNDDKTEFLIIGTRYQLEKVNIDHVSVGETRIISSLLQPKSTDNQSEQ